MRIFSLKSVMPIGIVLTVILFSGCSKDNEGVTNPNQIVGSGRLVSDQRAAGTFNAINVTGIGKVYISQDTVQSLRIEADDNILGLVTTTVSNGLLTVALKDGSYSGITVNVYASMKTIRELQCVGTAEFVNDGRIDSDSIVCRITGAGTITLNGTARFESVEIIGAGTIHNYGLVSSRCSALISGTGNIEVNVTQELDAIISGQARYLILEIQRSSIKRYRVLEV